METDELRLSAQRLLAAFDARTQGQLLQQDPDLAIAAPYELQNEVTRLRERRGEKVIGYKVGCTSATIREQLGVDQPIFGRVFDTGCFRCSAGLSSACYANLAIEGELAVRLKQDWPTEPVSEEQCLEVIATVFPVIELHNFVLPSAWPPATWLVASNGMHAGFVLAEEETACSALSDFRCGLSIRVNGVVVDAVSETGRIPDAFRSLRWLAGSLAEFGLRLSKGQVILTGSAMKLHPLSAGSTIVVDAGFLGKSCATICP